MIRLERREHVALLTFDRPAARNALTFAMWDTLRDEALALADDRALRAVVLTGGGGKAFVSGTDIAEFRALRTGSDGIAYERRVEAALAALERIRVPTIAAIAGACTGGGAAIAATCDLRIGAPSSRVGVPVARTLGNCLSQRTFARLAALIGLDRARALLLTAELLDAQAALGAGFLSEVVPSEEALLPRALERAAAFARLAPLTLQTSKAMALRLRDALPLAPDDDLLAECYASRDFRTGVESFLEKRDPDWTGT